jgi:hypothetical protein
VLVRGGDVLVVRGGGSLMLRREGYEMMEVLRGGSMNEGLFLFRDGAFKGLKE